MNCKEIFSSRLFILLNKIQKFMSTANKDPNYYEVLKVSPYSTQNDIKTAYYNLTKLYHPDKNSSATAKVVFQNVSDAYEILGNFNKRKEYDRRLNIGSHAVKSSYEFVHKQEQDLSEFCRSKKYNFNTTNSNHQKRVYNFDEWARLHYKRTFERNLKNKYYRNLEKEYLDLNKNNQSDISYHLQMLFLTIFAMITLIEFTNYWLYENYDKNLLKNRSSNKR